MDIENLTLISTDSITAGVRELIIGILGAFIGGILLYCVVTKKKNKDKEREKLEDKLKKHNQEIIDLISKYWFHGDNIITDGNQRQRTIEHLREGYPDIWNLLLECGVHKKHILECETSIRSNINDKLEQYKPFEWVIALDNIGQLIYKAIENFSINGGTDEDYKIYLHNFGLFGIRKKADQNDKYLMETKENFKTLVNAIVDDKTLNERFEFIAKERAFFKEKNSKFKQSIGSIKQGFEKRGDELKGTCKDCKDWHDKLKSLK